MRVRPRICAYAAASIVAAACIQGEGLDLPRGASRVPEEQLRTLVHEQSSGIESRRRGVIRTAEEWAAFWREVYATRSPAPLLPEVDFDDEMVIVAATGTRPGGGYTIDVEAVGRTGHDYHVVIRETAPGSNCVTTAALTQPVIAVEVDRTDGNVEFIERAVTQPC